jgi:hypothetical protein
MLDTRGSVDGAECTCRLVTTDFADPVTIPDAQPIRDPATDTHTVRLVYDDRQLLDQPRSGTRSGRDGLLQR